MAMSRAQKEQEVEALKKRFDEDETIVVVHNTGLTVAEVSKLRSDLRQAGGSFKVTKNTLARLALPGTKFEGVVDLFKGPTCIASSQDPVAAAKAVHEFAKKHEKLVVLGGAMGSQVLDQKGVEQLAKMPSLDELRGTIVGLLQAPASKLVGVLQAPAGQLARVTGAYAAKGE